MILILFESTRMRTDRQAVNTAILRSQRCNIKNKKNQSGKYRSIPFYSSMQLKSK